MMTVGMLGGAALAAAHADKQGVADEINAMADTDSRRANWMMRAAAAMIERGLADAHWEDDATPASMATFRADAMAIRLLNMAGKRADGVAAELADLKADLTRIDRGLASDRLDAAVASHGDERKIARAERLIDRGDALADAGRYGRAIRAYMRAWRTATRGMGDGEPTVTTQAANPAVALAVNYSTDGVDWKAADSAADAGVSWDDQPTDFQYVVTNTGDVELTNVALTDSVFADEVAANCSVPNLAPGETYTCTVDDQWLYVGDHVNTATVTATGGGATVGDSNSVYLEIRQGTWG